MSFKNTIEVLLGCDPQVIVSVSETANGQLYLTVNSATPGVPVDIDGLFLNVTDESGLGDLRFFPSVDADFDFADVTDLATGVNAISETSDGDALRDDYDIRVEYGPSAASGLDTTPSTQLTLWSTAGDLTIADLDLDNMAVVINGTDGPDQVLLPDGGQTGAETFETVTLTENFNAIEDPDDSALIASDGRWDVRNDKLFTNGSRDGELTFEEVATDGPVAFSVDARARNIDEFEAGGQYGDSLRVEVQIDNGDWVLLDEFVVNDEGTALVGSETGQEITSQMSELSYSGGILDTADDNVQFRLVSDISARNEKILFDNVEITVTEATQAPPCDDKDDGGETCVDFNDLEAGDVVSDQFAGVTISAQRDGDAPDSENDAMIFDSANPTGGDDDLAFADRGNIIIISEDNDSDDPDDEAHGGTISFAFDDPSEVVSLNLLDIEEDSGTIDLFNADGDLLNSVAIPITGDNGAVEVAIDTAGVSLMNVNLSGSGAVDDLCFIPPGCEDQVCDAQYDLGTIAGLPVLPADTMEQTAQADMTDADELDDTLV